MSLWKGMLDVERHFFMFTCFLLDVEGNGKPLWLIYLKIWHDGTSCQDLLHSRILEWVSEWVLFTAFSNIHKICKIVILTCLNCTSNFSHFYVSSYIAWSGHHLQKVFANNLTCNCFITREIWCSDKVVVKYFIAVKVKETSVTCWSMLLFVASGWGSADGGWSRTTREDYSCCTTTCSRPIT